MNAADSPPVKRRSQFGTRTFFVLIALAALAAWWARGEMVKEQRREELMAKINGPDNDIITAQQVDWRRRLGAWLRGRPPTPHVKAAMFNDASDTPAFREFAQCFPDAGLTLVLDSEHASPEMFDFLASVKVDSFTIFGAIDASDETLDQLARIRAKQRLAFGVNRVEDQLFRRLVERKLDTASISEIREWHGYNESWTLVTNEGLSIAAQWKKLEVIGAGPQGSDKGLDAWRDHPAVREVELSGRGYTDATADVLVTLPKLWSVSLAGTNLTDAGIARVLDAKPIVYLSLSDMNLGPETITAIGESASLMRLSLRNVSLSPELGAALAKGPVKTLALKGDYRDEDVQWLAPAAVTLEHFTLESPNVTDLGLAWLANAPKLSTLELLYAPVTSETVKLISPRPEFQLVLAGPSVGVAAIEEADPMFKLSSLTLYGSAVDDRVLTTLRRPIDTLILANTQATARGIQSLKAAEPTSVVIWFPAKTKPPLTWQEIADITAATDGRIEVKLVPVDPAVLESWLPKSSRRPPEEASSP